MGHGHVQGHVGVKRCAQHSTTTRTCRSASWCKMLGCQPPLTVRDGRRTGTCSLATHHAVVAYLCVFVRVRVVIALVWLELPPLFGRVRVAVEELGRHNASTAIACRLQLHAESSVQLVECKISPCCTRMMTVVFDCCGRQEDVFDAQ